MRTPGVVVVPGAVGLLLAVLPLLPVGPRYLGFEWPNAIDLAVVAAAVIWLVVRVTAPTPPRSMGAAGLVAALWAAFALVAAGATAIGLAAENRWDSAVFAAYWPESWQRALAPSEFTTDPFYPARAGLALLEGFAVFVLLLDVFRRAAAPARLVATALAGALAGVAAVGLLAIVQFALRYQLDPRWVAANAAIVRSHATFDDPNTLAAYLVLGLGLAWGAAVSATTPRARRIAGTLTVVTVLALMTTGSRTGQGSALIAALAVVAWAPRGSTLTAIQRLHRHRRRARGALLVIAAALLALVAAREVLPQSIPDRPGSRLDAVRQTLNPYVSWRWVLSDRPAYVRAAVRMAQDHPLTGVGAGRYPRLLPVYREYWLAPENAHNYFAQLLAETGWPGALTWLAVLGAAGVVLARAARGPDPGAAGVALGGGLSLLAFSLMLLTSHPLVVPSGQVLFGATLALILAAGGGLDVPSPGPRVARLIAVAALPAAIVYAVVAARTPSPPHADRVWGYEHGLYSEEWGFLPRQYGLPFEPDNPVPGPPGTSWGRFRWTSERALLEFTVPSSAVTCELRFTPLLPASGEVQEVRASAGDREQVVRATEPGLYTVPLDATPDRRDHAGRLLVSLSITPARSPFELGQSADRRRLGVQLFRPMCVTATGAVAGS